MQKTADLDGWSWPAGDRPVFAAKLGKRPLVQLPDRFKLEANFLSKPGEDSCEVAATTLFPLAHHHTRD